MEQGLLLWWHNACFICHLKKAYQAQFPEPCIKFCKTFEQIMLFDFILAVDASVRCIACFVFMNEYYKH